MTNLNLNTPVKLNDALELEGCSANVETDDNGITYLSVRQREFEDDGPAFLVYCEQVESLDDAKRIALKLTIWDLDEIIDLDD